jgi:hypothetical protein
MITEEEIAAKGLSRLSKGRIQGSFSRLEDWIESDFPAMLV